MPRTEANLGWGSIIYCKTTPCKVLRNVVKLSVEPQRFLPTKGLGWTGQEMTAQNRKRRPAATYEPTKQELAGLRKFFNKRTERAPRVKVSKHGELPTIQPDHPDETTGLILLMAALGTADVDFLNGFLSQLANASSSGHEVDEHSINFMLSVVKGIQPQDQIEAMLAAQMAAVHVATMTFARQLAHVENIPQQDSAERSSTSWRGPLRLR
jgi:hypothetical protein